MLPETPKKLQLPEVCTLLVHSCSGALASLPTPTPFLSPLRKVKIQFKCFLSFGVKSEISESLCAWKLAVDGVEKRKKGHLHRLRQGNDTVWPGFHGLCSLTDVPLPSKGERINERMKGRGAAGGKETRKK